MGEASRGTRATVSFLFGFVALVGAFFALLGFASTWGTNSQGVTLALLLTGPALVVVSVAAALGAAAGTLGRRTVVAVGGLAAFGTLLSVALLAA